MSSAVTSLGDRLTGLRDNIASLLDAIRSVGEFYEIENIPLAVPEPEEPVEYKTVMRTVIEGGEEKMARGMKIEFK